jgi:HTH-type transcriptional regulator/antitoxin HigA
VRIIARSTLRKLIASLAGRKDQPAVKAALEAWFYEAKKARWKSTADIKCAYATASIVSAERVVFNIKGNSYRLVVAMDFEKGIVWIKWLARIGTIIKSTLERWNMTDDVKPIRTKSDYRRALKEVKRLWGAKLRTREGDRLDVLATLIDAYEGEHYPMEPPDPIEAIKFRMEQQGLSRRDLAPLIGTRTRVAEVLNRKRNLSISMIRRLHDRLGISAEVLIRPSRKKRAA